VVGIEHTQPLVARSKENVRAENPELLTSQRIIFYQGDGWRGKQDHAPYDAIHVGAAAEGSPPCFDGCLLD
jgi:protein-L-isoaspartate(D-aspartate) O-methyltransferase